MAKELSVLQQQAEAIKTEVNKGANTSSRIGGMFGDILEYNEGKFTELASLQSVLELKGSTGFIVCNSAKSSATKAATKDGFVLNTNCRLLIKMTYSNTASNVTLNINNTGAKPLYYNNERANTDNYWLDGEVLDIYYDGNGYYASNVQGGNGSGGNLILEWNTDVQTTRKEVPQNQRKSGMQISYNDPNSGWINEQYIGTTFTDTDWANDGNWVQIVNSNQISSSGKIYNILENDGYIGKNGNMVGLTSYGYSNPIFVKSGSLIRGKLWGERDEIALLSITDESGSYYNPVVISNNKVQDVSYFIEEDCYIAACTSKTKAGTTISVISDDVAYNLLKSTVKKSELDKTNAIVDEIGIDVNNVEGLSIEQGTLEYGYIDSAGKKTAENNAFLRVVNPILIEKNSLIIVSVDADTAFSVIAKTDEEYLSCVPIVKGDVRGVKEYIYLVSESGYYAFSGYRSGGIAIKIIIPKGYIDALNKDLNNKIENLPAPNTDDFSLADWQTKIPYCYLFQNPVFGGDSVTFGHVVNDSDENTFSQGSDGAQEEYSYPAQVARLMPGWNVTKVAQSAITIKAWISTKFSTVTWAEHDLAFFEFGWNEQTPTTTIDEDVNAFDNYNDYADTIYGNYCKLIEMTYEQNPNIYIVMVISAGLSRNNQKKIEALEIIARKYNLQIINLNETDYISVGTGIDGIHFSPFGYIKKAIAVLSYFGRICYDKKIDIDNLIYKRLLSISV